MYSEYYYGPLLKAFESLDGEQLAVLLSDLVSLIKSLNLATDGTVVVPNNYFETVVTL